MADHCGGEGQGQNRMTRPVVDSCVDLSLSGILESLATKAWSKPCHDTGGTSACSIGGASGAAAHARPFAAAGCAPSPCVSPRARAARRGFRDAVGSVCRGLGRAGTDGAHAPSASVPAVRRLVPADADVTSMNCIGTSVPARRLRHICVRRAAGASSCGGVSPHAVAPARRGHGAP